MKCAPAGAGTTLAGPPDKHRRRRPLLQWSDGRLWRGVSANSDRVETDQKGLLTDGYDDGRSDPFEEDHP